MQTQTLPPDEIEGRLSLLDRLWPEVFQAERSAEKHPQVEAERMGSHPPAIPMQLVSAHATNALAQLEMLARARNVRSDVTGKSIGETFSVVRDGAADLVLDLETSYRGTLLGIRHGVDVMQLFLHVVAEDDAELGAFAREWLDERKRLMDEVEAQMAWFAKNPDVALTPVADTLVARIARRVTGKA